MQVETEITNLQLASVLNIKGLGRNKLMAFLKDNDVLQIDNSPYRPHIDAGRCRLVEKHYQDRKGKVHVSFKTVWSQKGLDYVLKLYNKINKNNT